MARKVFISILGTGPYSECTYGINNTPVMSTRYIQLATLKNLIQLGIENEIQWTEKDIALIFVTKKAEEDQWLTGMARVDGKVLVHLRAIVYGDGFRLRRQKYE